MSVEKGFVIKSEGTETSSRGKGRRERRAHLRVREHRRIPLEHALRERHLGRDHIFHTRDEDDVGSESRLVDVEETRGDLGSEDVDGEEVGFSQLDERVGGVDEGAEL